MIGKLFESNRSPQLFFQLCLQAAGSRDDRYGALVALLGTGRFRGWLREPQCDVWHRAQLIADFTLAFGSESRTRDQNLSAGASHLDRIAQIDAEPVKRGQDLQ